MAAITIKISLKLFDPTISGKLTLFDKKYSKPNKICSPIQMKQVSDMVNENESTFHDNILDCI